MGVEVVKGSLLILVDVRDRVVLGGLVVIGGGEGEVVVG